MKKNEIIIGLNLLRIGLLLLCIFLPIYKVFTMGLVQTPWTGNVSVFNIIFGRIKVLKVGLIFGVVILIVILLSCALAGYESYLVYKGIKSKYNIYLFSVIGALSTTYVMLLTSIVAPTTYHYGYLTEARGYIPVLFMTALVAIEYIIRKINIK